MASRRITRIEARLKGQSNFIPASVQGNRNTNVQEDPNGLANFLFAGVSTSESSLLTNDNFLVASRFPDHDPFEDFEEIRLISPTGVGGEESEFSFYNLDFGIHAYSGDPAQEEGFEIRPALDRGDTIMVSISPTTDDLYVKNGRAITPASGRIETTRRSVRRPDPVRVGDVGTVEGILPYVWRQDDPYSGVFRQADRQILPENEGRPLRYNTYFSVDEANMYIARNPRHLENPNAWPLPRRIAGGRFERDDPIQLQRKSRLIIYATQFMDVSHEWKGVRSTWQQILEWPRWDVYERSGYWHDPDNIPEKIRQAYADMAFEMGVEDRLLATEEPSSTNLNQISAGSVSVSFNAKDRKVIVPKYIEVQVEEFANRYFASNPVSFRVPL